MKISIDDLKKLREETQAGVTDCRQALEDAGGDVPKAKKLLPGQKKANPRILLPPNQKPLLHQRSLPEVHPNRPPAPKRSVQNQPHLTYKFLINLI